MEARKLEKHADEVVAAYLAGFPLDSVSMTREQRDALKRELLRQHPHLAQELTDVIRSVD